MIKKFLSMAVLTVSALFAGAQTPLPLDPAVKHGTLPNGLNYYIMHNEEPKERANFYIAQKVGSTLETPQQLGLAHFLEHMAFNGTTNFPGKNMLNYLQSKGIRFGQDINAYTGFDETVYRIDNVPTYDKALMDSVLLVLHDWSGSILLEEDEINAERGVIEEEWRSRNSADQRMYEAMLPKIYQEYQYQQMPIGKMEIVRNFPPQDIRDYYHKWYRPDQQGIVIVGDFDVAEMEQKVIDLFSTIAMPENPAERTYPTVSDNKEPIYVYFSDKELRFPRIMLYFKSDRIPFEMNNTVESFMQTEIFQNVIASMINTRLDDYSKNPDCDYVYAGVDFDEFLVSKTKDAFSVYIVAKNDVQAAFSDAMSIIAQACKTGFMESEIVRARDEIIANYEKLYNERNNTKTSTLGNAICRHFIDNKYNPGIETSYKMLTQFLPMIPVSAYNELAQSILTPENQVLVVSEPAKDEMVEISGDVMLANLNEILNKEYEAYVDEVITDPLIENLPAPGKITTTEEGAFGTTVLTLSNGAKVVVKPTDFSKDEIILTAFAPGGKRSYAPEQAPDVLLVDDAIEVSKLGNFDAVKLGKYLAGKKVSLGFSISNTLNNLSGSSTVKDLPTLMELIYANFTEINPDESAYKAYTDQAITILRNSDKNPASVFQRLISKAVYGGNPMFQSPTVALIESANYAKELEIAKNAMSNAANFTFVFTGNVDLDTFKPLVEQYLATLPSRGKADAAPKQLSSIMPASGIINEKETLELQVPVTMVMSKISGDNLTYDIANSVKIDMLGDILSNIYTDTLREEEGGTYSPYAYGSYSPFTNVWQVVSIFQTNDQVQEKLINRANEELSKLLKNGADETNFNKVKEAALKQYDIQVRTNKYWDNNLVDYCLGIDDITNHKAAIENLTLADFNKFLSTLYNGQNSVEVILQGVPAK